jgi:lipopolysaccharide biosynthesis regulator YciM
MVADYAMLLAVLVALLAGLTLGKAWERYKLREGRLVDRRRLRESPHYLQGLNYLVATQVDPAILELSHVIGEHEDAFEVHLILGNLYREKGQVGRAINVHQQLLQQPRLNKLELVAVWMSLALDYKQGGFVDRSRDALAEVLKLAPDHQQALLTLEKLHADQHQWAAALECRGRVMRSAPDADARRHRTILAFLETELGLDAMRRDAIDDANRHFQSAIESDPAVVPAYVSQGDLHLVAGNVSAAVSTWERAIDVAPDKAHIVFDRLARAYTSLGAPQRFEALCRRLIAGTPADWRARLALARHLTASGAADDALTLLLEAVAVHPHAMMVHEAIWDALTALGHPTDAMNRYTAISREAVFYHDPHVCMRCRYRSTELLWQCPHCHDWNTFIEERLTPADDDITTAPAVEERP